MQNHLHYPINDSMDDMSLAASAASAPSASAPPPARFNFARHVLDQTLPHTSRVACIDDYRTLTYRELAHRVRCVAAGLLATGLQRGDRLLFILHDSVDFPVAFLAAVYAGIVPVPVNTSLHAADYSYLIEHSEAKCVVASQGLLAVATEAISATATRPQLIVTASDSSAGVISFDTLLNAAPLDEAADTGSAECAFWLYTSGSTGRPKAVRHAHASLYWTCQLYAKPILALCADDVVLSAAKLFFAYGLGNGLTFPLSVGATVILIAERPTPQTIFQRLVQYQPTVFFGIPTLYVAMFADAKLPSRAQVALRLCVSAGEALPRDTGEQFGAHFGCNILDGLGSTEMLHIYLSNRIDALRYGTSGKPVPGYEIVLRTDDDESVDINEPGELYVRGPSAALMVSSHPGPTHTTTSDNWVRTGDHYRIDADGFYISAGRSDDMLKVSGQYVAPIEVEAALMAHDAVLECAVVGKPDADGLIKTAAFVVLREPQIASSALSDELKNFVKSKLAPHKYPRNVTFVDALPKTATGKIQRYKLRAI